MKYPSTGSVQRLQKILSKRLGRELLEEELVEAYDVLMEFAFALANLEPTEPQENTSNIPSKLDLADFSCIMLV